MTASTIATHESTSSALPSILLVRHGEVVPSQKTICYGCTEVELSQSGRQRTIEVAKNIAERFDVVSIWHSGLTRTAVLAEAIVKTGAMVSQPIADDRLLERDYGRWHGRTWDEIFAEDPDRFHDLIDQPDTYAPHGGETTTAMQRRVVDWFEEVTAAFNGASTDQTAPSSKPRTVVACSYSGPIAALGGHITGRPAKDWAEFMVDPLGMIRIDLQVDPQNDSVANLNLLPNFKT